MQEQKLLILVKNPKVDDNTVLYEVHIIGKDQEPWMFKSRYSEMREIHDRCIAGPKKNLIPDFPHRKLFGNFKDDFIQKRRKEIENYYNTLLRSVELEELPELAQFFNSHRPKKENIKPIDDKENKVLDAKLHEANKEKILRKKFDEIMHTATEEMVANDFIYDQVDEDMKLKFSQEFQKLKLDPQSKLLDSFKLPAAEKDNDSKYCAAMFQDDHEKKMSKISAICDINIADSFIEPVELVAPL